MEGENTMEKRLRVFRAHWRIFLWRSEVIELLKSSQMGISNETFTCKPRTFLFVLFFRLWKPTTLKAPNNFQNLNLLKKYKTYQMGQTFRGHGPKLVKEVSLVDRGERLKNPSGVECGINAE